MRQRASIPLLGIDERPNERQQVPGLASTMRGLRPKGLEEEPYWVAIENVGTLKNSTNVVFNHASQANLVKCFWHNRGRIGKNGDENGSLRRLVCLFNTGVIEVIDPDFGGGWDTVVSINTGGGNDFYLTQQYDVGYITVTSNGRPIKDYLLEDDLLIEAKFPELPKVITNVVPSDETYTQEQLDGGNHKGFKTGRYYVRFAYNLGNNVLVKHSLPEEIYIPKINSPDNAEFFTAFLHFIYFGYETNPSNYEFWKDKIKGVVVLISNPFTPELEDSTDDAIYYELTRFAFIDRSDVEEEEWLQKVEINDETVTSLPLGDVDDNTHHTKTHGPSITYNSRLMLGRQSVDFAFPRVSANESKYNVYVYRESLSTLYIVTGMYSSMNVAITNISGCTVVAEALSVGNLWRIKVSNTTLGYSFRITITENTKIYYVNYTASTSVENGYVLTSNYVDQNMKSYQVLLEVDLETETGAYKRCLPATGSNPKTVWASLTGPWSPRGYVLGYNDLRAKNVRVHAFSDLGGFGKIIDLPLREGKRANYAAKRLFNVVINNPDWVSNAPNTTGNTAKEYVPNKVVGSVINSPLAFESDLVYLLGKSNTAITAFAVNALEVSQGQFGQYPLYVFKEDSIWAMEQSGSADVVFARMSPIDTSSGLQSEDYVTNLGATIIYANKKGIYYLEGTRSVPISYPVESILPDIKQIIGFRRENELELVVSLPNNTYFYSFRYKRWFTGIARYNHLFKDDERLYALDHTNAALDFEDVLATAVGFEIILPNIHFGIPDTLKRFYYFYLRNARVATSQVFKSVFGAKEFSSTNNKVRPKWKSVYDVQLEVSGTFEPGVDQMHKIDTEFSVRYPRKLNS